MIHHSNELLDIVVIILNSMLSNRHISKQANYIYLCTFILLRLSQERSFSLLLNTPYNTTTNPNPNNSNSNNSTNPKPSIQLISNELSLFHGTYGDLYYIVICKLINTTDIQYYNINHCLLSTMSNTSPYIKYICPTTALKLILLYERLSDIDYLCNKESNYIHLSLLVDVYRNIIQYQFDANPAVLYSIYKSKEKFIRFHRYQLDPDAIELPVGIGIGGSSSGGSSSSSSSSSSSGGNNNDNNSDTVDGNNTTNTNNNTINTATTATASSFIPTVSWHINMVDSIPMFTLIKLIDALHVHITEYCNLKANINGNTTSIANTNTNTAISNPKSKSSNNNHIYLNLTELEVTSYIQTITLVGILPQPHPIIIRKFPSNLSISTWFSSYLYGTICMNYNNNYVAIFDIEHATLFNLKADNGNNGNNGGNGGNGDELEYSESESDGSSTGSSTGSSGEDDGSGYVSEIVSEIVIESGTERVYVEPAPPPTTEPESESELGLGLGLEAPEEVEPVSETETELVLGSDSNNEPAEQSTADTAEA